MAHKLLLADDSLTIQRVIELTFADEDIQVIAVGDGEQAIERIRAERPDIVLADVGMPQRDGFEVAAFVKQTPELSHIPVLLLTGAFEPVDDNRVRAVGCDGVLAKPFEPQLLISRVKQLLATPPDQRTAPSADDLALDDQPLHAPATPSDDGFETFRLPSDVNAPTRGSVDDYFEHLDAAFASAGAAAAPPSGPPAPAHDWLEPTATPPAEPAAPVAPFVAAAPAPQPAAAPSAAGLPPEVAAAFAWLLAEEQGQPIPAGAIPVPSGSRMAAIDTAVDEITRRVVERLADRGLREQVADIVSGVAERLVREEIERLKAGLK